MEIDIGFMLDTLELQYHTQIHSTSRKIILRAERQDALTSKYVAKCIIQGPTQIFFFSSLTDHHCHLTYTH